MPFSNSAMHSVVGSNMGQAEYVLKVLVHFYRPWTSGCNAIRTASIVMLSKIAQVLIACSLVKQ